MERIVCLSVELPLAHLSTIHSALTQLIESGVPATVSRVIFKTFRKTKISTVLPPLPLKRCLDEASSDEDVQSEDESDDDSMQGVLSSPVRDLPPYAVGQGLALSPVESSGDLDLVPDAVPVLVRQ